MILIHEVVNGRWVPVDKDKLGHLGINLVKSQTMGWLFRRIWLIGSTVRVISPYKILHGGNVWIALTDKGSVVEEPEEEEDDEEEEEDDEEEDMTNLSGCRVSNVPGWMSFGCRSK